MHPAVKAYGLAILVTSASLALTRLTWPMFASAPFAPVFGAVAITAHWGSERAGLFAVALAIAGLAVAGPRTPHMWTAPALVLFGGVAVLGCHLIAGRKRAVEALRANEAELRETLAHVRESEARLRRAQKMEAVGQLAAGVAHNFNNLLQVTMGYTDILMDSRRDGALDEAAIAEIRRATERGASLTRQLLAFGRQHDARPARVEMDPTVDALRDMLTRAVREDITFTMDLDSGDAAVLIDPGDLEQVVVNLVLNSRDALPQGGAIHVDVSRETVDAASRPADSTVAPGEYVRLRVRDNGTGMTPEIVSHLFEPFFTTKEVGMGTGLGLPFVDGVVRHAGGFITIDTAPGTGTTVSVFLPLAPAAAVAKPAARATVPMRRAAARTARILLVEDEGAVRAATARILTHAGYTVIEAERPQDAVAIFARDPAGIDLLLTDIVMAEMHGPELAERLLASRPGLPVVFISGYADVMPSSATATAQMAFLPKPFAAAGLVSAVERLLVTA